LRFHLAAPRRFRSRSVPLLFSLPGDFLTAFSGLPLVSFPPLQFLHVRPFIAFRDFDFSRRYNSFLRFPDYTLYAFAGLKTSPLVPPRMTATAFLSFFFPLSHLLVHLLSVFRFFQTCSSLNDAPSTPPSRDDAFRSERPFPGRSYASWPFPPTHHPMMKKIFFFDLSRLVSPMVSLPFSPKTVCPP